MKGLERIKILASDITDKPLLKIIDYLLTREDMNEKYLNEEKTLEKMISFIKKEASKEQKNGVAMIEDDVVYGWAIHYFDESDEKLGIIEKEQVENDNEIISNTKLEKDKKTKAQVHSNSRGKNWVPEGQLSLF